RCSSHHASGGSPLVATRPKHRALGDFWQDLSILKRNETTSRRRQAVGARLHSGTGRSGQTPGTLTRAQAGFVTAGLTGPPGARGGAGGRSRIPGPAWSWTG